MTIDEAIDRLKTYRFRGGVLSDFQKDADAIAVVLAELDRLASDAFRLALHRSWCNATPDIELERLRTIVDAFK